VADPPYRIAMIVGIPRSGTTFLQVVLGTHGQIVTCRETHLFERYIGPMLDRYRDEAQDFNCSDGIRHHISRKVLIEHLRALALSVFSAIHARSPNAAVVLEKTPGHVTRIRMINTCFPEARFIHIIRDPRGVAASMKAAADEPWGKWAERDPGRLARRWSRAIGAGALAGSRLPGDRYREVRYEDLFVKGGAIVNDLYSWLGLPPDDSLPADLSERFPVSDMALPEGEATDPRVERRAHFFRRGDPGAWHEELSRDEVAAIEAVCADRMLEFGYLQRCEAAPSDSEPDRR
jgi:hypothetical protein